MDIAPQDKQAIFNRMIENTVDINKKTSRVKGCVYGDYGPGKTVLVTGLCRKLIGPDKKIVIVDTNEGVESIRNHKALMHNIEIVPFESVEQLYVLAESIQKGLGPFVDVGAIIFDDADFIAERDLTYLWHKRVREKADSRLDPDKPERPEYLKLVHRFGEVLDYIFKHTPNIHVFLTAHQAEKKTETGNVISVRPNFSPALADTIAQRMLILAHMTAKIVKGAETAEYERILQVHPTFMVSAKSRIGFEHIKYDVQSFIDRVVEWSLGAQPEDNEAEAIRKEIQTSRVIDETDKVFDEIRDDDDEPVVVS